MDLIHATAFEEELTSLLDRHCSENDSDTPDFILATFMMECLRSFNVAVQARESWYSRPCGDGAAILLGDKKQ